jgi:hypothetical protein
MELTNRMKRKPIDEVVDAINKIVDWYRDGYNKCTIEQIIDMRSKLTAYLYTFATYVGDVKEVQLQSETDRKIKHSQKRKEFMAAENSIAKSEDEALLSTIDERKRADEYESYYITLRLMLDQANKVDDVLMQRISILKQEKSNAHA